MSSILNKNFTYDDYLKINDDKRYEIIEGELIMNPAPSSKHQIIINNLGYFITDFVKKNNLGQVIYSPYDVILDSNVVVQPDILYISKENIKNIKKRGLFGSPDLVVEIVSPSSLKRDTEDKRNIYKKYGIKEYWIIFPNEEIIEVLELEEGTYKVFDYSSTEDTDNEQKVKSKVFAGLEIKLKDIF
jgi:Uma2 family endonuclease